MFHPGRFPRAILYTWAVRYESTGVDRLPREDEVRKSTLNTHDFS